MNKILQYGVLSALVVGMSACGGSSSKSKPVSTASSVAASSVVTASSVASSLAAVVTTTYTVSVDVPVSMSAAQTAAITLPKTFSEFLVASAQADEVSGLTAANFAVVIVDLAGNVLRRVPLADSDISKNTDGSWSLVVPGDPRLDCVIVADVTKPIVLEAEGNINQDGFVFAPTTAESVDIDVGSTAAFKNFIEELGGEGTFEDLNINPADTLQIKAVENLVNTIQIVVADQTLTGYANVTEALAAIKSTVADTVKQEVLNVKNPAEGTAVTLIRDEGGLFWFEGRESEEIAYGGIAEDETEANSYHETSYYYDGEDFVLETEEESEPQLVLSSGGWTETADKTKVANFNDEDGTVTLQDVSADGVKEIAGVTQVFDLAGRNVSQYLGSNYTTSLLGKMANPETTFGAGAKGYRVKVTNPADVYQIHYQPGAEDGTCPWNSNQNASTSGGNCNFVMMYGAGQSGATATSGISSLFSQDVAADATGFVAVDLGVRSGEGMLIVQLLDNAAKTERFYLRPWTSNELQLVGQGTWSEFDLPGLSENKRVIHIQIPQALLATSSTGDGDGGSTGKEGSDDDKGQSPDYYVVQQAGFLRPLYIEKAGVHSEDVAAVFNGAAKANILTALEYEVPPTLLPTATIVVDGTAADWTAVTPAIVDPSGDQNGSTSADLTQVSIARSDEQIAVLMKVAGNFSFPYAPERESSHYEVALHFHSNASCIGEGNGFVVVNNYTSATEENTHVLNRYFEDLSSNVDTQVVATGSVMETSFPYSSLPDDKGNYISLTAVVHSFTNQQPLTHDESNKRQACYKFR